MYLKIIMSSWLYLLLIILGTCMHEIELAMYFIDIRGTKGKMAT
jgi:hypothetical protein